MNICTSKAATPKYELLREAAAIIDGIPAEQIHLDAILTNEVTPGYCGTIACAIGWLGLHPEFSVKTGIETRFNQAGYFSGMKFNGYATYSLFEGIASVFGITYHEAKSLFGGKLQRERGTHKHVFRQRVRNFLMLKGQMVRK